MSDQSNGRLLAALDEVRKRIRQARDGGDRLEEQTTKAVLIEPILSALGWDTQEWREVRREYRHKSQDDPVDYALFLSEAPALFVEAKALGVDLNDRRCMAQAVNYANTVGLEWCVLTNGTEYCIYNAHAAVDVEDKLFKRVSVTDPDAAEVLSLLAKSTWGDGLLSASWRSAFVDRQVQAALSHILVGSDPGLLDLLGRRLPHLDQHQIRDAMTRASIAISLAQVPGVGPIPPTEPELPPVIDNGDARDWFFNTNETYCKGAYGPMLKQGVIAVYGKNDGEQLLSRPRSGDRVFIYVNGHGVVAVARVEDAPPFSSGSVFGKRSELEFQRRISLETVVDFRQAIDFATVREWDKSMPIRSTLCRLNRSVADRIASELRQRHGR